MWSRHTSTDRYPFQLPEFCDYRDQNGRSEALAGFANWSGTLTGEGAAERLPGVRVSDNFFELLGARAAVGRTLRSGGRHAGPGEGGGALPRAVAAALRGGPRRGGASLTLNGESFAVVGVLERGFFFPVRDIEVAIPLAPDKDPWRQNRDTTNFIRVIGRARDGVSAAQITADFDAIASRLQKEFPGSYARKKGILAVPYREELTRSFRQALSCCWGRWRCCF